MVRHAPAEIPPQPARIPVSRTASRRPLGPSTADARGQSSRVCRCPAAHQSSSHCAHRFDVKPDGHATVALASTLSPPPAFRHTGVALQASARAALSGAPTRVGLSGRDPPTTLRRLLTPWIHVTHDPTERASATRPERRAHPLLSPVSNRKPNRSPVRPAAWPVSNQSFGVDGRALWRRAARTDCRTGP